MARSSRSRFPPGFVGFRPDLGSFLKRRRQTLYGKQQTLADAIGLARPSLSAIENGHAFPLPDTVAGLMRELSLTWPMMLVAGETDRIPRTIDHTAGADQRLDLGQSLREGRRLEGLKLRKVAERCGMSAAQLSRIERAEHRRSSAYEDEPDDAGLPVEYRRIRFRNPELRRLSMLG